MRKLLVLVLATLLAVPLGAGNVNVTISDGVSNTSLKNRMESRMSSLLSEVNTAYEQERDLKLDGLGLQENAAHSILMLWENCRFTCSDREIVEHCIETGSGYQVRNIPLLMKPDAGSGFSGAEYQEAVISFDSTGAIESFYLTISTNLYMDVVRGNLELTDLRRRQLILDYVEHFRTSYNQKDINFLEQVFSDDALIITGKVISQTSKDNIKIPDKIQYKKQSKQEYLTNLRRVFNAAKYIRVTFDEIKVKRHPTLADFYGVTLHQGYTSSNYHDDGYLFLLWDFTDEDRPLIHVRTWQPDKYGDGSELAQEDIFCLEDFDI